jgi:hypothetical protein
MYTQSRPPKFDLWQWALTRSTRAKLAALFVPIGLLSAGAWVWSIYRQPNPVSVPPAQEAYDYTGLDPLMVATQLAIAQYGENPNPALVAEQLTLLLPDYQTWLQAEISQTMAADIFWESERLRAVAKKEVELGNFNGTDPLNSIDLEACRLNLEPWQCVLLRYAGEGIQLYANAEDYVEAKYQLEPGGAWMRLQPVYIKQAGLVRYFAALRAIFPEQHARYDASELQKGLGQLRFALFQLESIHPAALAPISTPGGEVYRVPDPADIKEVQE